MDFGTVEMLRERHPAWRILRAGNASLVLSFLGAHFVDGNRGATAEQELVAALDEHLDLVNAGAADMLFPRSPKQYLTDWSAPESGWLRRFYPHGSDEVHYDATPAFEKAYNWVSTLRTRPFVGTESRLHTVVELLRQIVHGTETDQEARLSQLHRQRSQLDDEIREAEQGNFSVLSETAVRDRYQQFAGTARELLSDFREVEDNFRRLDRDARERIASWNGPKGELLAELVSSRTDINSSDQGSSFQAFYDFLLSEQRQNELADLLSRVQQIARTDADARLRTIHHDWSEAADRTQRTVRQISEQLRRFLDDQVWLENRRVLDIVRAIESSALGCREEPPHLGLTVDLPGVPIALPFERPLYSAQTSANVESMLNPVDELEIDVSALFTQAFVDQARLAQNIRALLPSRSSATLDDIIDFHPVEQGAAEIMRGVVYRESQEDVWSALDRHGAAVRDHFATVGVGVVVDDTEGYAYLQSQEPDDDADPLPRLVRRRSLTYNVSLMLVLLRKRLVEFETTGGEGKLVLPRDQIVEMLRVFLADSTNEARVMDRVDNTMKQVADLGFVRPLRGQPNLWEVRRVLKAYVDAQILSDFSSKLHEYIETTSGDAADD